MEEWIRQPVSRLKARFLDGREPATRDVLEALEADSRRGARELAARLRESARASRAEGQRLRRLLKYESELWAQGFDLIAGVDEAGVAPLAGPVVAGAVVLARGYKLRELDDSKKLDESTRGRLAQIIKSDAVAWAVGVAEVEEIEVLNIYHAGLLAMRRAVEGLKPAPDFILVDARKIPDCAAPQRGLVHGDSLSASIAAASIIAKTTRDAMMVELNARYPGYGLDAHKGYPTRRHLEALRRIGASPIHRRGYGPVREVLGLEPVQETLFEAAQMISNLKSQI
ncbi:MAG TPA: ribonuclease HII [Blastocatellia bacterium]|jgi:ribonuclease HII|nr:ribonuclease HII [Blastocatellia bacterium]